MICTLMGNEPKWLLREGIMGEILLYHNLSPMGDELKWLLKDGGAHIFESCDNYGNMPTSQV